MPAETVEALTARGHRIEGHNLGGPVNALTLHADGSGLDGATTAGAEGISTV
jgi:hypothetical protein